MNELNRDLIHFSETGPLTARDAVEGTFVTGSPGSGKTSTAGKQLADAFLESGWGGLVVTAKREEAETWMNYCRDAGREQDLIVFSAASGHLYDPLFYEFNRPGRGNGDIESIIDFFNTLLGIGKSSHGHSADPFWERASEQLMRNSIALLSLAKEPVSLSSMSAVIDSLPTRAGQYSTEEWQKESYCAQLFSAIRGRQETLTPDEWSDLNVALTFASKKWPCMDERPRSSVYMTWAGMADKFMYQPLSRIFCSGKCTFLPEHTTHDRKIIVVDFPLLEYGLETGRLINCMLKLSFTRAWLRRDVSKSPVPVFLWQDEGQYYLLGGSGGASRDNAFAQVCRSSRVATVFITQNILNVSEALGEHQPGSKTKALLANFGTKIFFQNNCVDTNEYASGLIGKEYRFLRNVGVGGRDVNVGRSEQRLYKVEPEAFTRLRRPDGENRSAEALIYQGGKRFLETQTEEEPDGRNYVLTTFSR